MKKIGLLTINDDMNLGNRLQNYASYVILSKYHDTKNIVRYYSCEKNIQNNILKIFLKRAYIYAKFITAKLLPVLSPEKRYLFEREMNFLRFNNNIRNGERIDKNTNYEKLEKKYDYFVVGSDQIWNPNFFKYGLYINMLGFVKDSRKKLSMSSSVSCAELTQEQKDVFKRYLPSFSKISCREQQGADLIKEVTGMDCASLIDPTLMLEPDEWKQVMKKPKCLSAKKDYILIYFLGEITKEYESIINNTAKKYNCEIINIFDKSSKYYSCGPSEFLYLILNSRYVLTDSFHGTVFSYIFDKPFRIFSRKDNVISMNTRFTNIIDKLGLDDSVIVSDDVEYIDFKDTVYDKAKLKNEQIKFKKYLDDCFLDNNER